MQRGNKEGVEKGRGASLHPSFPLSSSFRPSDSNLHFSSFLSPFFGGRADMCQASLVIQVRGRGEGEREKEREREVHPTTSIHPSIHLA